MAFSTSYPPYNFHSTVWNIGERRDFFPDCGSFCGVHVDETGKATVQKEHNSCKGEEHLYAKFSSLPLFEKPKVLQEHDAIGIHQMNYINKKMTSLHKRLRIMKTICHKDISWQSYLLKILKAIYDIEEGNEAESMALNMFSADNYLRNFYEEFGNFLDVENVWHSNHKFIGGCLQSLNFSNQADSTVSLAAITGPDFKTIKIITPQMKDSNLLTIDEKSVHEIKLDEEMFDLSCQTLYETTYCLSRSIDKCFLYEIKYNNDGDGISSSLKDVLHLEGKTYTSINLSPYILGECLVADHTGSVFLWNIDKSIQNLVHQQLHRFPCSSNWCKVHYASHPRSIVLTNQSTMELIDIRTSCRKPRDVFALPSKFLSKNERISASCCSWTNPFHHFVATNHGLFLIDERFLGHPVLQWQHMLEGIPHYLSPICGAVQSSGDEVLLAASQYPNEVVCLQYRTDPNHPPISTCSPWRVSRPGDLYYIEKLINQIRNVAVHERLIDPIVGVAGGAINSDGMYVFQLNSLGDIFYQAYGVTNVYEDKTFSPGPGDSIVKHSEEVISISKNWLEHLENQLEEKCSQGKKKQPIFEKILELILHMFRSYYDLISEADFTVLANVVMGESLNKCTRLYTGMFESTKGHVLCQLCMPQCHNSDIDSDDDEIISGICNSCDTSLLTSKRLVGAIEVDGITKSSDICYNATPPSIDNLTGENRRLSKKLYKHWYDVELSPDDDSDKEQEEDNGDKKEEDNGDDARDSLNSLPKETSMTGITQWCGGESSNGNDQAVTTEVDKEFDMQETQLVVYSPTHLNALSQQTVSPSAKELSPSLSTVLQESDRHKTPHKTDHIKLANSQPTTPILSQTFDSNSLSPPLSQRLHANNFLRRKRLFTNTNSMLNSSTRSNINQFEDGFGRSPTHSKMPQFKDPFARSPSKERLSLFSQQFNNLPNISSSLLTPISQSAKTNPKHKYQEGF